MGSTTFAKGKSGDIFKPVVYATHRHGAFEVGVLNTDSADGITSRVMAADKAYGSLEVPDWRHAVCVATDANTAANGVRKVNLATPSHTHYRVEVRSQATAASADYIIYTEDEA